MIYILIPTYNEKDNLPPLVAEIIKVAEESGFLNNLKILIIDDNSPDGTGQLADELGQKYPLAVIHRPAKLGLGSAYVLGMMRARKKGAEYIIEMDADFSHQSQDILRLIKEAKAGADLAIGSRKIKGGKIIGWNWRRKLYSNGAMHFARLLLGLKTHDITAGFRCFRTAALNKVDFTSIRSNGYAFQVEMIYRLEKAHLKIVEVPVVFPDRTRGQSKLNGKDILEFFKIVVKLALSRLRESLP